jgi:hypothetical protein
LASIVGQLLYCCRVVRLGRLFLNRALEMKQRASQRTRKPIILDRPFHDDIGW